MDLAELEPDATYGTFLFGCLAPDVNKLCDGLDQGTTHFLPKDADNNHLWRRSQRFLDNPTLYLRAPFPTLGLWEQAFVLGYLCHVATDEITARMAWKLKTQLAAAGRSLPSVDAMLTAIESELWVEAADPERIAAALERAFIPPATLPFAPFDCLQALHQMVLPQVREGAGLLPYLNTVRRQWQWLRHGRVSDATDDVELEARLADYGRRIQENLSASESLVQAMEIDAFLAQATDHSSERLGALLKRENVE
jgi:hypothetical protein